MRSNADFISWASIRTMADELGISPSTVQKCIKELKELGLLNVTQRWSSKGDKTSNLYQLMVPDFDSEEAEGGVPPHGTPCTTPRYTGVPPHGTELKESEEEEVKDNSLTGSADAEAAEHPPVQPPKPKEPKPDPYRSVIETYSLAGLPEPPSSEVTPLLRAMKQALASGWPPTRIAAAWSNARARCNPQSLSVWSLAYTLRHLTDAEAMQSKPPGSGNKPPRLSDDELEARARANAANVMGELYNDR